ncbi:NeuD/PglB/VioB family sugar acetyltransferase [Nocardioides campestrisoli]|uniref:NeuD/PglB/VioB family sugar acetyltransferase n=1 Tax=Nocardioides campestrisoli TaxID=2736757 RepID=UPI00163D8F68|nr:NeuD/PglB/VioB family sugar acetyltransferase [Nocardioides campestrisoli]
MTGLLVVAASGLAREVLAVESQLGRYPRIAVLDDDRTLWGSELAGHPVVGGIDLVAEYPDHDVLVCAGRGQTRRALVERLSEHGVGTSRYPTCIHPQVLVPESCRIDAGCVVLGGVVMTADVRLSAHVVVMPHVTLTHDDVVDEFATLCAGVQLGGGVRIGPMAYLGMSSSVREGRNVGPEAVLGMGAALTRHLPAGETWVGVPARRSSTAVEVER